MVPKGKKNLPAMTGELPALALANYLASLVAPNVGRYLTLGLESADKHPPGVLGRLAQLRSLLRRHEFTLWPAAVLRSPATWHIWPISHASWPPLTGI